jgi:hypothetical protein
VSGSNTITTAATVFIGVPVAGANATITNPYALNVQGGSGSNNLSASAIFGQNTATPIGIFHNIGANAGFFWSESPNVATSTAIYGSSGGRDIYINTKSTGFINLGRNGNTTLYLDTSDNIGTFYGTVSAKFHVKSGSSSLVALRVDSAATPSVDTFQVSSDNGTTTHFKVTSTGAPSSPGAGTTSERYGASSVAAGTRGVAFGYQASASNTDGLALGYNPLASGNGSIALGTNVTASGSNTVAIDAGGNLTVSGSNTVAIGTSGSSRTISGQQAVYIGNMGTSSINSVVVIGTALPTAANQVVISPSGSSNTGGEFVFFGKGVTHATPTAYTINGTGGSGTNIAGAALNLAGGKGTGTGTGGDVNIQFARAGSTGSSLNTLSTIKAFSATTTGTTETMTGPNGGTNVVGVLMESITLSTSGTTTDSTIDLPANSIILSVTGRVTL